MIANRITAGVLCLAAAISALPSAAFADEAANALPEEAYFAGESDTDALDIETLDAALPAVENLRSGNATENAYTIAWDEVEGADGYKVYRYNSNTRKFRLIKTTAKPRVRITGLSAGQKNTYRVVAYVNVDGVEAVSSGATGKFTTKPAKVEVLKVKKNQKGYITFRWRRVKNATSYNLYYSANGKKYKLFKTVKGNVGEVKTGLAPTGKKLYFKVRAVSETGGCKRMGDMSPAVRSMSFNKLSVNDVMNKYTNSRRVTQVNAQGYKLSENLRSSLNYQLTKLGGDAGFMLYDIDSGSAVGYNADSFFYTASTVKMPYVLYTLRCMENGSPTLDTKLTYKPSDYNGGSGWIKTQPYYTTYSIRRVIEVIGDYSDNCGYYMLQDRFGYKGYNNFIKKLGGRSFISAYDRWGNVTAADSVREWACMWNYMQKGRYRSFAKHVFSTSCVANVRDQLGGKYTVYEKTGWITTAYNDTALVEAEHPYIVVCFSNRTSAERMRQLAKVSESIHNEMWNYYDKK